MKLFAFALAVMTLAAVPSHAQSNSFAGTWRVDGAGPPFPWEVVLRVAGSRVTGMVNNCTSRATDITQGRIQGSTVTFSCTNGADKDRTIAFTGELRGEELHLTWRLMLRQGGIPPNAQHSVIFGESAPKHLIARRVPDATLAATADSVRGLEFASALNLREKNVKAEGRLFIPDGIVRVRTVILAISYGLGPNLFEDLQVRQLAKRTSSAFLLARLSEIGPASLQQGNRFSDAAGADALFGLLRRLGEEVGHRELDAAPILIWGHSAGGSAGTYFALNHPRRVAAFVLYHSAGGGAQIPKVPEHVPVLAFQAGKGNEDEVRDFWIRGRQLRAPWTFVLEPDAEHMNARDLPNANMLLIPWIEAVLRVRLSAAGTVVQPVTDSMNWLGDITSGDISPYATFNASKSNATWLPDEASARAWQRLVRSNVK